MVLHAMLGVQVAILIAPSALALTGTNRGGVIPLPPPWLIQVAVASVWLYEGLWCKLLRGRPHEFEVVESVPYFGPRIGTPFLLMLGMVEVVLSGWVLVGAAPLACVIVQTLLLVALNVNGLLWARHIIPDPAGMIVKNFAFLVLAWVAAGLPALK